MDPSHPLLSLWKLAGSLGVLLTFPGRQAEFAGLCVYGLIVSAGVLAVREIRAGKTRGVVVVLAGLSPVAAAVAAGALRLYPVLEYPRMLLFLLPSLAFLAGYVVDGLLPHVGLSEPLAGKWKIALPAACALGAIASQAVFLLAPHASEENRPAVRYIQARLRPDDLLYIHGGMYEQFEYYTKRLDFHPRRIYVGKPDWPCCATGDLRKPTSPQATSLLEDMTIAAQQSRGHNLWLLMPAGSPGHWSAGLRAKFEEVPQVLASDHCTPGGKQQFGQTLVESWSCR